MKLQVIQNSLQAAESWEKKGQPLWVGRCLASALMNYLSVSLERFTDHNSAAEWLNQECVLDLIARHLSASKSLAKDVDEKRFPGTVLGGNYHLLVFSHLAWLLAARAEGESYASIAIRPDVLETSTPFWREYARGVNCMIRSDRYSMLELQPRGQEVYWMPYLKLIQCSSDGELQAAITEVDRSFAARNADKGVRDDSYEIEGSGGHPVAWDFRKWSLLRYLQKARSHV